MPRQNLTANACTVCRKKRTKCDGRHPCRRCVSRGEDCVYEDKMWRTKDHLRSEIERLRKEVLQCQGLIKALTIGGPADEWKSIQTRMHRGEPPERIAAWIASSRSPASPLQNEISPEQKEQQTVSPDSSHPSISPESDALREPSDRRLPVIRLDTTESADSSPEDAYLSIAPGLVSPAVSGASSGSGRGTSLYPQSVYTHDSPMAPRSLRSWTGVTQDIELLHRLLYHYFDNCFPDFSFVCKERFMKDLDERTGVYCSPALVNSIFGLASQSYGASPDCGPPERCPSNKFLVQANELLRTDNDRISIANIQATGVLALAEANIGNDEAACQLATECVRKAVLWKMKMDSDGAQFDDLGHREAMATTFCGAFSLVRIFRILTGRLSCQTGPLFMRLSLTPEDDDTALDSPAARVERGVALQQHFFSQLDHCTELLQFISTITEIAHTFCSYHHDDGVTPADLIPAYDKCLQAWEVFNAWVPSGSELTKDVLFAEIWYNYILLILCSTLVDSDIDLQEGITPKTVVIRASETIIFLTGVYQEQCGFLSVHPLLPHMVFAATLVQLRRPCDENSEHEMKTGTTGDKRKRLSASHTPITGSSTVSPHGNPLSRSPSQVVDTNELVYPPWKQHVAPATMNRAGIATDIKCEDSDGAPSAHVWPPSKPAFKLAAEGTLHLTKIGITNRKSAELARSLHARSNARPVAPTVLTTAPPPPGLWTPGWKAVNWGPPGSNIGAGFGGLGVDSLQGFSAMTTTNHPPMAGLDGGVVVPPAAAVNASAEYIVAGDGSGYIGGPTDQGGGGGIDDSGGRGESFAGGGLYIYPNSGLPQMGCGVGGAFDGYGTSRMDCVGTGTGTGAFAGGVVGQEYGTDELV